MSEPTNIGLDNQLLPGHSRPVGRRQISRRPVSVSRGRYDNQFLYSGKRPKVSKQQPSEVFAPYILDKKPVHQANHKKRSLAIFNIRSNTPGQWALIFMAVFVFSIGIFSAIQAIDINHKAAAQVAALSKKVDGSSSNSSVPSTTKPSSQAIRAYTVAPDLPRYLTIPKLDVFARVLQVGILTNGALGTPNDIYDTAWYTGSAKPGQSGATLIDGHVSSWTTKGVFYNLKNLQPGDPITITKGDGQIINYQVVKTITYSASDVNMTAALTPITAGKSGLNLITCTGQVIKGTSQFNQRVIVFASQI